MAFVQYLLSVLSQKLLSSKTLSGPDKVSEIGYNLTGENESWWICSEYRVPSGAGKDMLLSSILIWEVSEWPTSVAEFMTLHVRFTSQLSRRSMDSLTGGSTPSCIAPAMNGKRLYRQKLDLRFKDIGNTLAICWGRERLLCEPVVQVREKELRDKGIHSCATKCAVARIVLWRVRIVEATARLSEWRRSRISWDVMLLRKVTICCLTLLVKVLFIQCYPIFERAWLFGSFLGFVHFSFS